jgi:hypothetical protein
MQGLVVAMLDIGKTPVPCERVLGIQSLFGFIGSWDSVMYDHPINDLSLEICLGVEGSGFGELGIQQ